MKTTRTKRKIWLIRLLGLVAIGSCAQSIADISGGLRNIDGTDSLYLRGFNRKNDFRLNYTSQRYLLNYGSRHKNFSTGNKFSNVSDLVGFGLTYKFIDFDIAFSLPQSQVLQTGLQNLKLFRLAGSFSSRNWTVRTSFWTPLIFIPPTSDWGLPLDTVSTWWKSLSLSRFSDRLLL